MRIWAVIGELELEIYLKIFLYTFSPFHSLLTYVHAALEEGLRLDRCRIVALIDWLLQYAAQHQLLLIRKNLRVYIYLYISYIHQIWYSWSLTSNVLIEL